MNEESLLRDRRALMRSINNYKVMLLKKKQEAASIDNCVIAGTYIDQWHATLTNVRKLNEKLLALIDTTKYEILPKNWTKLNVK